MISDGPTVVALLNRCRPSAIGWLIISSRVRKPIYAASLRAIPHILKKILETVPSDAHTYADGSVQMIFWIFWIGAAIPHRVPSRVGSRLICAGRLSMFCLAVRQFLMVKTSARFRFPISQLAALGQRLLSARALAVPASVVVGIVGCSRYSGQSSEHHSCQILCFRWHYLSSTDGGSGG